MSLCAVFCCHYSDSCWESSYKHQDLVGSSFILNRTDLREKENVENFILIKEKISL